jgi:hypothetical protein
MVPTRSFIYICTSQTVRKQGQKKDFLGSGHFRFLEQWVLYFRRHFTSFHEYLIIIPLFPPLLAAETLPSG